MVSCTSAFLLVVALKCLVPVDHFAYLPNLAADLESDAGSILGRIQQHETKWQKCGCITYVVTINCNKWHLILAEVVIGPIGAQRASEYLE